MRLVDVLGGAQRAPRTKPRAARIATELARLAEGQGMPEALEQSRACYRHDPDNQRRAKPPIRAAAPRPRPTTRWSNPSATLNAPTPRISSCASILRQVADVYRTFIGDTLWFSVLNQSCNWTTEFDEKDVDSCASW